MQLLRWVRRASGDERGQGTFEYLMVSGVVVIAFVTGLFAFDSVVVEVVGHVCPSVDTANPVVAVGSCLGIG